MIGNIAAGLYGTGVAPVTSSYESISTVTVGSGGSSSISFTSIPSTYKHLQIRGIIKGAQTSYGFDNLLIRLNATGGTSYARHVLKGDGSSATALAGSSTDYGYGAHNGLIGSITANVFTVFVMDILDYADTNKYKTVRSLIGTDNNGSGNIQLTSTLFQSTSAVNEIQFYEETLGNIASGSTLALYGIKD